PALRVNEQALRPLVRSPVVGIVRKVALPDESAALQQTTLQTAIDDKVDLARIAARAGEIDLALQQHLLGPERFAGGEVEPLQLLSVVRREQGQDHVAVGQELRGSAAGRT